MLRFPSTPLSPVVHGLYRHPETDYTRAYFLIFKNSFTYFSYNYFLYPYHDISWKTCVHLIDLTLYYWFFWQSPKDIFIPQIHTSDFLFVIPSIFLSGTANFYPYYLLKQWHLSQINTSLKLVLLHFHKTIFFILLKNN